MKNQPLQEENGSQKIKLYLVARISKDAHCWNEEVCSILTPPIEIFVPHHNNPHNLDHPKIPESVVKTDIGAMERADIALALPEFGNDCSFETGWFAHAKKPIVYFVNDQLHWLRDWMIKAHISRVITNSPASFERLKNDEVLQNKKVTLINRLDELNQQIEDVYWEQNAKKLPS